MSLYARWLAKKFWTIFAVVLILSAVLVQLGRLLSPMVAEHKTDITDYLGEQLGMAISVEDLSLRWAGLRPELEFSGLDFISPSYKSVVTVERAQAQIDLLGSLTSGRLRMWRVELETVGLSLTQSQSGRWNLSGYEERPVVPVSENNKRGQADPINAFLIGRYIHLQDIVVDFQLNSGASHTLQLSNMLLQNQDGFHRLSADLLDAEDREMVRFVFEGEGDPRDPDEFSGRGYLGVQELVLQENLALFSKQLESRPVLKGSTLSSELWLSSSAENRLAVEGNLLLKRDLLQAASALADKEIPQQFSTELTGDWRADRGWRVALQDAQLQWPHKQSPALNIEVTSPAGGDAFSVKLPTLALEPWLVLMNQQPQVPALVKRILSGLNPRGLLRNLHAEVPYAAPLDFTLQTNLEQVSIDPRNGVPGITALNGFVKAGALEGYVDIDSGEGFSAFFPDVYEQPIPAQSIRGQVGWFVDQEANQVLVNSGLLELEGEVGSVAGYFFLDAPVELRSRPSELVLQLGLVDSDVTQHKVLVPYTLPESLLTWLDQSLVSGAVPEAGFVMRAYFGMDNPAAKAVQLGINAEDSHLKFDPQWPALDPFSGFVVLDDRVFSGFVDQGTLLGSGVRQVGVELKDNPAGQGSLLRLDGQVKGGAADGLSLLIDTPLKSVVGSSFDEWSLTGELEASVALSIPLQANQPGQAQDVRIALSDAVLGMEDLGLTFNHLSGDLRYSSERGLEAEALSAQLWQQPLLAAISSVPAGSAFTTLIDFQGTVPVNELSGWLKRPEVDFMQGVTPVTGLMTIPAAGEQKSYSALLELGTDLSGVELSLPGPYGKPAETTAPLSVAVEIKADEQFYEILYSDLAGVGFVLEAGSLTRGLVTLHGAHDDPSGVRSLDVQASDLPKAGLLIDGELRTADAEQWLDVFERYGHYSEQYAEGSSAAAGKPLAINLELSVDELRWDELRFDQIAITGEAIQQGWRLDVQHSVLAGEITWFENKPLLLDLDYLHWPLDEPLLSDSPAPTVDESGLTTVEPKAAVFEDPLADIDPRALIALDFKAKEVKLGDADFGRWSFKLRPDASGIRLIELEADVRGATLGAKPKAQTSGAEFSWHRTDSGDRSHFTGMVSSTDLVTVMESWGQHKAIESKRARLVSDLSWVGSPAAMTLSGLQGEVVMDIEKGRFFQNTGQASNALLRLFGLFNFDSWARRLRLDFSDLYKGGMAFDNIDGRLSFAEGQIFLVDPVVVDTPSATLQMGGQIGLRDETLNTSMVATLPVGGNATLIAAFAAGLPIAAGVYAVSKLFKRQVDKVASVSYSMNGSWSEPAVKFNKLFDNKSARKAAEDVRKASAQARERDAAANPAVVGESAVPASEPAL